MADNFKHKNTDLTLINDSGDLDLIRQYTEAYNKAYAEGDKAGQQAAHDAAEKIRAKYDYSGGVDGSEYIKLGTGASPAKADTSWLDKLGDSSYNYDQSGQISAKLDALLNRTPFSYDAASDPLYQQYRKQYTREADRSAEDVLGKAAVMTGGMPSTAAVAASQQASDYQMSQMTDKIPELQQLAYSMYQDKLSGDRADLNTLIGLEDNNYNRWMADRNYLYQLARDQVGDQQTADALAYQKQQDKLNYDYQKERDAIEDARYNAEWQYKLQQAAQQAARRNTRVITTPTGGGEADYDGLFAAAQASGYPKSFISNNYKKYGFSSSSSLYDDYESWLEGQGGGSGSGSSGKTLPQGQFIALLSGFNTSLKNGEGERILSTLDKAWPLMTSDQKAEMQKLLTQYGYSYEEG
jgi:hypothetical protein|nr:MAG TPA: hypothetical protein [Caudoviricetes sp.]DAS62396.1 MAG TPA: hypothetical protein [Caudoviricetes sp.]